MVARKKAVVKSPQEGRKQGEPFEVSQSTIKNWRKCRRLYWYRFIMLLRRRRPILQLIRGTMIGKCIDLIALARHEKKTPKWQTALVPFKKEYAKLFAAEKEMYGDPIAEVERIVTRYEMIYAKDGLTYKPMGKHKDVSEFPIRVELAEGIVFAGHIDKMPVDREGRIWDMDHKSHKNIPDHDDRFRDLQQVFYQWAMPLSGYERPTGVIWDYLRTKAPSIPEQLKDGGLSKRKNIDTDYETYLGEVTRLKLNPRDYADMLGLLKPRGLMDFYLRVPLPSPSKTLVENVVQEAKTTAIEIREKGGVDKTRSIDFMCKRCEFYNLCQAEFRGLDTSYILKAEYETNPDPRHIHIMEDDD